MMSQYDQAAPPQEQPLSEKERESQALDAAYLAEGYINADGQRDHTAVGNAIYPLVARAHVEGPSERTTKAVTKGELVTAVFPSLPRREDWPSQPDPALAEKVDGLIRQKVWDLVKPDKAGFVQQLVGVRTPELILCRTKIGTDNIDAVYVTNNLACIKEDFIAPLSKAMRNANRKMGNNVAMAGVRLPEHARAFDRLYRRANKLALEAGLEQTQLMLESTNGDDHDDDGDE
jgi:hypothetical protein